MGEDDDIELPKGGFHGMSTRGITHPIEAVMETAMKVGVLYPRRDYNHKVFIPTVVREITETLGSTLEVPCQNGMEVIP